MSAEQRLRDEGFFDYKKSRKKGRCLVKRCGKAPKVGGLLCHCHYQVRWRSQNPEASAFSTLRDHAKGRNLEFNLSYDYWKGLTHAFAFYDSPEGEVVSIDRIDPCRGYVEGNVRVVSLSLNVVKGNRERYLPEHVQAVLERERAALRDEYAHHLEPEEDEECPF